ncbi:MAG: hypothetical protein Q9201_000873 [Fulgogasparrea decipioides]
MAYRVELATSKRAGCKNAECNKNKIKIDKGELRLGVWVTYRDGQSSWAWRHWGCVTPAQLAGIQDALEGDMEMFDGYEELPADLQEKVKQAVGQGHVDDDDWKGDLDQNRPGKRGFRSPAAKKKKEKAEEEEALEDEDGDKSPSKSAPKKRGRAKKDEIDDDHAEEPVAKKTKVAAKKGGKSKVESEADEVAIEGPAKIKDTPTATKAKHTKGKNAVSGKAAKGKAEAFANEAIDVEEENSTDEADAAAATPKKTNAAAKKGKKSGDLQNAETHAAGKKPTRVASRSRKAKVEDTADQSPISEDEDQSMKPTEKVRAPKNTANTKKPISKKVEKDEAADATEAPAAKAPKAKKGRKKAGNSKTKV